MTVFFELILSFTLIAFFRNVIGLTTYGLFGPALLSLSLLRIGNLGYGLLAFAFILGTGLCFRLLIEPLKLQYVHRSILLIISVCFSMGILSTLGEFQSVTNLGYVNLFPIVISSLLIESFIVEKMEKGWTSGAKTLGLTILTVLAAFLFMRETTIAEYVAMTPETWALILFLNLYLGTKVRVRLSDLFRFPGLRGRWRPGGGDPPFLTVNVRNRDYIEKVNPRPLYPKITKLGVKEILKRHSLPVPGTIGVVETFSDLGRLKKTLDNAPRDRGFVIKPNNSTGGKGILVVKSFDDGHFDTISGERLDLEDLENHIRLLLLGEFSKKRKPDVAVIEERVINHPRMAKFAEVGLPDLRVIVYKGVPVMAMTRIPTLKSGGKANIHQGAVGAGVDLKTGRITNAVEAYERRPIAEHPETGARLVGEEIPFWQEALGLAVEAQQAVGLGYCGVDVVIDHLKGLLIMEINKRPGLEIQNANNKSLLEELKRVDEEAEAKPEIEVSAQPLGGTEVEAEAEAGR